MILKSTHNNVIRSSGELGTMHRASRIPLIKLNEHLTCKLCKGYFIDATTIIECLHTFCKSCIVKYLEKNKYCPECDVQVHKTKPLLNIRPDKTLQDIVYKLVPRLFQNETQKRQAYYADHPESKPTSGEQKKVSIYQHIVSPDETICLTINYHGSNRVARYLRCQAAVSIAHIQKLIRAKYDLTEHHRVDVLYNQDCLNSYLTLMDIAYIYMWKRKEPLELTYRIYERTVKRLKLDKNCIQSSGDAQNDWKEVQLRISENGEMSVTGIQDSIDIINEQPLIEKEELKSKVLPLIDCLTEKQNDNTKLDLNTTTNNSNINNTSDKSELPVLPKTSIAINSNYTATNSVLTNTTSNLLTSTSSNTCATTSTDSQSKSAVSATCVTTTETSSLVTTPSQDSIKKFSHPVITSTSSCGTKLTLKYKNLNSEKGKHKLDVNKNDDEPPEKQSKQTILNHALGVEKLSNNHPLKKHSQLNRNLESTNTPEANVKHSASGVTTCAGTISTNTFSKPQITPISKISNNTQLNRPGTPILTQKWNVNKNSAPPCYVPKTNYNPIINIPNVQPSTSVSKITEQTNKLPIKTKPSTPIGYKTLRDPPKTWNPQISRPNINKSSSDPKYSDSKNVRPAKFFKMRNNMPRYLGNPASGVKPLYQVHVSPEKEKSTESTKSEKSEIKKHSIVKIDPKTLKPISERAPETSNLSNQTDLKINTSSVSIFNPLKLQSSPKSDRKSPKSPHSPKKSNSPPSKRDKINLSFTPPNPFVPNLTSPTMNPTQFLYPTAPGFPPYDPRVMAAYRNFFYGQGIPFPPAPLPSLSLDLNQRKNFELHPPTSPQLGNLPQQQQSPKSSSSSLNSPKPSSQSSSKVVTNNNSSQSINVKTSTKKGKDGAKNEKSLQNAVEKLTQNRLKSDVNALKQDNKSQELSKEDETIQNKEQESTSKNKCDNKDNVTKKDEIIEDKDSDKFTETDNNTNKKNSDETTLKSDEENKVHEKNLSNNNTDTNNVSLVTTVDKK